MTKTQTLIGFAVCIATILLAVLDMNIVSAATVPIARDLDPAHGVDKIPWLISTFALASAAALPLYGKLCDSLGAKKVFVGAVATFLLGSTLCGAAQSMTELIAARALQGLGGGGLMSVTMVVLAQLKGPDGKGGNKGSGIGGIVAGTGMAVGPWVGGTLADHANWRWIFYINLPLGITALVAAILVLKLPVSPVRHRIDYLGAALAAAFTSSLLLLTSWGGQQYAWGSPQILGLAAACVVCLALFLHRQRTAAEPVLPLSMFKVPQLRYGFAIQGLLGAAMMGALVYVMVYLQAVRGLAPAAAGLYLIPMALGMTAVGLAAGRLTARGQSVKTSVVIGTVTSTVALALLATLDAGTSLWLIRAGLLLMGCGFGLLMGQLIPYVQNAAPAHQLGVATTSIRFFQTLGNALGAAVFGTLLSRVYEANVPGGSTSAIAHLTGAAHDRAVHGFVTAMDVVFLVAAAVMAVAAVLAARLPAETGPAAYEPIQERELVAA
ncbi:MFS transporter [Streptomyces sp. NPDC056682]|uniref:MFS transporter n=1 Tax=Streptomyces sp. NPDC056682 TaxID=3345909 RepID=UPI00369962B1